MEEHVGQLQLNMEKVAKDVKILGTVLCHIVGALGELK